MLSITHHGSLTEADVSQLLKLADPVTRSQIFFSLCVGATAGEVTSLSWGDVDLADQKVWLEDQLGSHLSPIPRLKSLPSVLTTELRELWAAASDPDGLVWADAAGISEIPVETRWADLFSTWSAAHRQHLTDVAPPSFIPDWNALRDFTINVLLSRGVPPMEAAHWAGLTTAVVTKEAVH